MTMKNVVLKLSAAVALALMTLSVYAQDAPVADVKVGPWVTNVGADAFNVLWTSSCRTLSYVEVAPDDGTDFDACERPRFYQTVSGRRVIDTFHDVRVTGLEPGVKYRYRIMSKPVVNDDDAYHTDYGEQVQLLQPSIRRRSRAVSRCLMTCMRMMTSSELLSRDAERTRWISSCLPAI